MAVTDPLPRWLQVSPLRQHIGPRGEAKRGFEDRSGADAFALDLNSRPNASRRRPYQAYRCRICKKYHAGRKPAKRGARNV